MARTHKADRVHEAKVAALRTRMELLRYLEHVAARAQGASGREACHVVAVQYGVDEEALYGEWVRL